jgi:hypothetical protein
VIQNRCATRVKKSCSDNARFKAQPVVNGAVSWTSQLQKTTALSTTEAETIAASEDAKKVVWWKRLLSERVRFAALCSEIGTTSRKQ